MSVFPAVLGHGSGEEQAGWSGTAVGVHVVNVSVHVGVAVGVVGSVALEVVLIAGGDTAGPPRGGMVSWCGLAGVAEAFRGAAPFPGGIRLRKISVWSCYPVMFSHSSPAPVKTDRAVRKKRFLKSIFANMKDKRFFWNSLALQNTSAVEYSIDQSQNHNSKMKFFFLKPVTKFCS